MGLVEELYANEDLSIKNIYQKTPFSLFHPNLPFLRFKFVVRAIEERNPDFFIRNIGNNFLPNKGIEDILETKREAINRGINTLNVLCKLHIPEAYPYLSMEQVDYPFDPLKMMTEAREKWLRTGGTHPFPSYSEEQKLWFKKGHGFHEGDKNKKLKIEAYNAVKSWGLGHFVLIIDESPEIFNSVRYQSEINQWFQENFQFTNPTKVSENCFSWDNKSGIPIFGTRNEPFRKRAKIYDDSGNLRYDSLLIKLFLKEGFLDRIYDTYGVELVVKDDHAVKELVSYFRNNIRMASTLEKFEELKKTEAPAFRCAKFVIRTPIRLIQQQESLPGETRKRPLEKYIRVPVEVQLRPMQETNHQLYEKNKYLQVFPFWYPREIYEPILREIK